LFYSRKNAQIGGFLSFFVILKWIPIGAARGEWQANNYTAVLGTQLMPFE
jgi:hypothetical protein